MRSVGAVAVKTATAFVILATIVAAMYFAPECNGRHEGVFVGAMLVGGCK